MQYRFGDVLIDSDVYRVERSGAEVHVEPQVFDLLRVLADAAPNLVTYDDLIEAVWGGRIVSDATMAARISSARAAVGDTGKAQRAVSGEGPPLVRVGHWLTHLDLDWHSPIWRPVLDRLAGASPRARSWSCSPRSTSPTAPLRRSRA